MKGNGAKVAIVVVCLLLAGVMIAWNFGWIGGSSTTSVPGRPSETSTSTEGGTTDSNQPAEAGKLVKDKF